MVVAVVVVLDGAEYEQPVRPGSLYMDYCEPGLSPGQARQVASLFVAEDMDTSSILEAGEIHRILV